MFRERDILEILAESPFFIKIISSFQDEDNLYFLIDYVNNGNLNDYIIKNWPLDKATIKHITQQLVLALDFMHSQGICHRDLKPQNILLDDELNIKICDLGEAKHFGTLDREKIMNDYESFTRRRAIMNSKIFKTPKNRKDSWDVDKFST